MRVLITGVTGTGKSTIAKTLNARDITALDFRDIKGLCAWYNKETGGKIDYTPINDPKWFTTHKRICDIQKLKETLDQYKDIVIAGIASGNQTEYLHLFDKVILLQCSREILISRMQTREARFGKTKVEQEHTADWQQKLDSLLLPYGAIPINTEGPLDIIVDKIVAQLC